MPAAGRVQDVYQRTGERRGTSRERAALRGTRFAFGDLFDVGLFFVSAGDEGGATSTRSTVPTVGTVLECGMWGVCCVMQSL